MNKTKNDFFQNKPYLCGYFTFVNKPSKRRENDTKLKSVIGLYT